MRRTATLVLAFALLLAFGLVGCAPAATPTATPTTGPTATLGPPTEIVMMYPTFAGPQPDILLVQDAVNKLSVPAKNITVKFLAYSMGDYMQQASLLFAGGDQLDLFLTLPFGSVQFQGMVSNNQCADITDLVAQYGANMTKAIKDVYPNGMAGTTVNGKLYGMSPLNDVNSFLWLYMAKAPLEKYGLDLHNVKNLADLEAVVKTIYDGEKKAVLGSNGLGSGVLVSNGTWINFDDFSTNLTTEFFGSASWTYGGIIKADSTTVENPYASDYFKKYVEITRQWYLNGWIDKEAAADQTTTGSDKIKAGKMMGAMSYGEYGFDNEANAEARSGVAQQIIKIADTAVSTGRFQKFVWVVPAVSQHQDVAIQFLDWMFTSKEWNDLINYGIKDKHYLVNADGTFKLPDGIDFTNNPYSNAATFFFGNQFLSGVMAPEAPDLRDKVLELDKKAVASQFLGYTFDGTSVMNEIAAVNNKVTEYYLSLTCGNVDPATALPKFLQELDDSGYATIIAENQKQLDAWLASKK